MTRRSRLPGVGTGHGAAYGFLAAVVSELLDARCAGIYLPQGSHFWMESDGTAAEKLRRQKAG